MKTTSLSSALLLAAAVALLSASCASSPNWSGAETEAGEFVWRQSPGVRFYINVIILAIPLLWVAKGTIKWLIDTVKKTNEASWGGVGCGSIVVLLIALVLWDNVRSTVWAESFSINAHRIERTFYPTIGKAEKETLEWNAVSGFYYLPDKFFEHKTWIRVFRFSGKPAGGQTEEYTKGRAILFGGVGDEKITLALEKRYFDTSKPEFLTNALGLVFGSEDFAVSADEEKRLKAAILKFMPDEKMRGLKEQDRKYLEELTGEEK